MQNSLKLLVSVADYEDRKLQLEGLKNRLEAIASPAVVQAFNSNNTGIIKSSFKYILLDKYSRTSTDVCEDIHLHWTSTTTDEILPQMPKRHLITKVEEPVRNRTR